MGVCARDVFSKALLVTARSMNPTVAVVVVVIAFGG
jgi:hypothetical protein